MDAVTLVAAALAIAAEESWNAALQECLLQRERAAMTAEDRGSFLAQRLYTGSTQVPSAMPPMTWRAAHTRAHNEALELRDVMDEARRALRRGYEDRALALLEAELDRDELVDETSEEELAPPPIPHRCAGCGRMSTSVTVQWPARRWADLPVEQRMLCDACEAAVRELTASLFQVSHRFCRSIVVAVDFIGPV